MIDTIFIAKITMRIIYTMQVPEALLNNVKTPGIMDQIEDINNNAPITIKSLHMLLIGTTILTKVAVIKVLRFLFGTIIKDWN